MKCTHGPTVAWGGTDGTTHEYKRTLDAYEVVMGAQARAGSSRAPDPASAGEAVAMYRELAQADPDRYRPDLAASLRVLADSLDLLGRTGDGLAARSEAAALTGAPAE